VDAYRETLMRFAPLVGRAELVVPGHGAPLNVTQAQEILAQDVAYVDALRRGAGSHLALPEGRRNVAQKRVHAANLASIS
jgi:hypothetical protein